MRLHDWQSRFAETIKVYQQSVFEWGFVDCCIFACDCIVAVTGIDPGGPFRGKYGSRLSGTKLVKDYCGGGLVDLVERMAEEYGFLEVTPPFAQRGDLGLYVDPKEGDTLGINIGATFAFLTEQGMIYLPRAQMARCWRVE